LDVIIVAWARLKNVVHVANHIIIAGMFTSYTLLPSEYFCSQ